MNTILLSAGGTGGHLFPAEALAHELVARGWAVHLATDGRAVKFTERFPGDEVHTIKSATFGSKNPVAIGRTILTLWRGYRQSKHLLENLLPKAVVGFGGYPTLPPLYAAKRKGIPIILQEQNAVLGRANRLFASASTAIATGFPLLGKDSELATKTTVTGNPLRPPVLEAAKTAYPEIEKNGTFRLLVFGGSQGAQYFSEVLPKAMAMLPEELSRRLDVTQQARPEDQDELVGAYSKANIVSEVSPFFTNMPGIIARSHLVICRAGASTVSELAAIGRPSVLVPYPFALDHDQAANAARLYESGGTTIVKQSQLTPERLASILNDAMTNPASLAAMAGKARTAGIPDAASRLADVVEHVAKGGAMTKFKDIQNETA